MKKRRCIVYYDTPSRSSQKTNFRTHLLNFVRLYSSPSMFVVNTGCLMFFTLNQMYAGTMEVYPAS